MPETLRRRNIIRLTYISCAIIASVFCLSISPPSIIRIQNQPHNDIPVGEIHGHTKMGQSFEVEHRDLSAIEVLLATYGRENKGVFVFHLREDIKSEDDMVMINCQMREVQDNSYFRFSFPRIENVKGEEILFSKGNKYYFYLEAPHAEPGNAITIWSSSEDLYKQGEKIINGAPSQGDLVFKTEYELGWRLSFPILATRLTAILNFFLYLFKNQVFYFVIILMSFVWVFVTLVKKFNIFYRKGGILLVFGIVFMAVCLAILMLFAKKIEVYSQFEPTHTAGEIYGEKLVGQTFRARHDHLVAVEVLIGTYQRRNTGELIFHLREQGENTSDLTRFGVDMPKIKDNRYYRFEIPEIRRSQGRKYYFYLEAPNSQPGNAVTVWCNDREDKYRGGTKIIDGKETGGDLVFKTIYAVRAWEKIGLFLEEITRNKPSPLNKKSFYMGLIFSFILACSLFLTYIIKVFAET